jgi:2-hydroxy-6-oxonona-2,4-dienedioate hydrolase
MTFSTEPLDAGDSGRDVTVDGMRIHYHVIDRARSSVPVVFTHGGGPGSAGWNNFLYNARAFAERYTCYFYDMPGYGDSDCPPIRGPVHSWHAETFLKFLDALKIGRAHLVNQSFGGSMAIKLAAMAPDRVDHLVLTGSRPILGGLTAPVSMTLAQQAVRNYYLGPDGPTREGMRNLIGQLEFREASKVTELNVNSRYQASINPKVRAYMADPSNRGQPESLIEQFRNVKARTLIVNGAHDIFCSADVALFMMNQFADARVHLVGNAAHHVQTECAAEYNAVVLGFLP